jgi:hypothetical protein
MAKRIINNINNNNQEISKYKLLSSTAGVGAIVNTKLGYNVVIHEIGQWDFIKKTHERIKYIEQDCRTNNVFERSKYFNAKFSEDPHWERKISFVQDLRFLSFLKERYEYRHLELLVSLVDLTVDEKYNSIADPLWDPSSWNHDTDLTKLTIPATHFPKYFYNGNGDLKHIADWSDAVVKTKEAKIYEFAPPFDILKKDANTKYRVPLKQVNLVLICDHGHISEIPWSKFITYKRQSGGQPNRNAGIVDLFALEDCCKKPDLKWTESTTRSEGFSSVRVECRNCQKEGREHSAGLDGVTGLRVQCKGHRPWVLPCDEETINLKNKRNEFKDSLPEQECHSPQGMLVTLATANNTYFANSTSSLFIPYDIVQNIDSVTKLILRELDAKFDQKNETLNSEGETMLTKQEYADQFITAEKLIRMRWPFTLPDINTLNDTIGKIKQEFLGVTKERASNSDLTEEYRYEEYKVFRERENFISASEKDLEFERVPLPASFNGKFDVVCKINSLKITSVQLNFSRVTPTTLPDPTNADQRGQNIYNTSVDDVRCLPAVQSLGEGIFFSIDQNKIEGWIRENEKKFFADGRSLIFNIQDHYQNHRTKIDLIRPRYFLVHTLCHLIMKELEFKCGYPLASLKERLFISDRMAAFMIMTSDGSEGSMGGLVSQVAEGRLQDLVENALRRAEICSSDPLCWENIGALNLASCFSCSIVSETACEERNLCLDRRLLLDPEFGFFKDIY